MSHTTVALLGRWHGEDIDWQEIVVQEIDSLMKHYGLEEKVLIRMLLGASLSSTPFLPEGITSSVLAEMVLAKQQILANKADLTVIVDNGKMTAIKERHLKRLYQKTGVLLIWLPPSVHVPEREDGGESFPEEKIGIFPGQVLEQGTIKDLAAYILFFCVEKHDLSTS